MASLNDINRKIVTTDMLSQSLNELKKEISMTSPTTPTWSAGATHSLLTPTVTATAPPASPSAPPASPPASPSAPPVPASPSAPPAPASPSAPHIDVDVTAAPVSAVQHLAPPQRVPVTEAARQLASSASASASSAPIQASSYGAVLGVIPSPGVNSSHGVKFPRGGTSSRGGNKRQPKDGIPRPREKSKPRTIIGKSVRDGLISVKGADLTINRYVGRWHNDSTANAVKEFISNQNVTVVELEELDTKHGRFKSFRLRVKKNDISLIEDENFWPEGVVLSPFFRGKETNIGAAASALINNG